MPFWRHDYKHFDVPSPIQFWTVAVFEKLALLVIYKPDRVATPDWSKNRKSRNFYLESPKVAKRLHKLCLNPLFTPKTQLCKNIDITVTGEHFYFKYNQ